VKSAQFRPESIATIFEHMDKCVDEMGVAASQFTLGYQKPDDVVVEGQLVPVIVLMLQPVVLTPVKPVETPP
jgi:hypothetical protein